MEFVDQPASFSSGAPPAVIEKSEPPAPPPTDPSKSAARPKFKPAVFSIPKGGKKGKGEGFAIGKAIAEGIKAGTAKAPAKKKAAKKAPAKKRVSKKVDPKEIRIKDPVSEFAIKSGKVKLTSKEVNIRLRK